jgi:hypothetical protein
MSKNAPHAKHGKSPFADWEVRDSEGAITTVTGARLHRDKFGDYIFTDDKGVAAVYLAVAVISVTRKADPAEAPSIVNKIRAQRRAAQSEAGPAETVPAQ